jgi:serine/threonine protein kinase
MIPRDPAIPATAGPPEAAVCFFLGSRTPAAASPAIAAPPPSGSPPLADHEWGVERYHLRRRLGGGTFGDVYLAEDRDLGREVAIKLPKRPRLASEQDAVDFLSEARNLARLDHPGIVPVYDVGRARDGRCYVVSKHIDGEDLGGRLEREGRLEPNEAAELVRQVAWALHHAHNQGLVHRDIKPENILLGKRDRAYVADFGLALKIEDVQLASRFAGSPAYMSPEQITGDVARLDGRSDIFSLGVVLYELLVGGRPFRGASLADLFRDIRSGSPMSPDRRQGGVPEALGAICMRCLAKRPADRFQTGKQLADALHRWLTPEEPVPLEPDEPLPPPTHNLIYGIGMMLVSLVLAYALTQFWPDRRVPGESGSKPREIATSPNPRTVPPPVVRNVTPAELQALIAEDQERLRRQYPFGGFGPSDTPGRYAPSGPRMAPWNGLPGGRSEPFNQFIRRKRAQQSH